MKDIVFPKSFVDKLKSDIRSEILSELENRKMRVDSEDIELIMDSTKVLIERNKPRFDNEELVVKLLSQVVLSEEEKKLAFNKDRILSREVRTDFINDILDKIEKPKDGVNGLHGQPGKDGKDAEDYTLTDQDKFDIAESVDLKGVVTEDLFNKRNLKLIKDLQNGRIKLPARSGASGPEVIKKIDKALGTTDWQKGLPGDGELGGNLEWIDLTDEPTDVPTGAGVMSWNNAELSLDIQTGIGPTLQVGQETYILICNDTGSQIDNFTVLRPVGGTFKSGIIVPTVEKAKADNFATVEGTLMVSTMDIPDDTIGLATTFGRVRGADTSMFGAGDGLFVSATTAGDFTNVAPEFPNYPISMGGVLNSDATEGEFVVSQTRNIFDTITNFWNGVFRETFDFTIASNGTVITGSLTPANGHPDMTMMFSDGFTMLTTTPAATITLTAGTDSNPQENFIFIPKSTKVLTVSTSDWPTAEHIKVCNTLLRTATATQSSGALSNRNWNDHIEDTDTFQGHLSHIGEKLRQFEAQWDSGAQGTASGFSANFYVAVTAGVVYQLHKQTFPALSMPTNDIHVVNNFTTPYVAVANLNTQTLNALGNTMANSSFSFVVWGVQNKVGEPSHLMCNLPVGGYSKNSPASAVSDANNYSVYSIPKPFQGTAFLIARFTVVLQADGTTWSLFDTEDLRGKIPNTTAGGGAGGTGVTILTALTDYPAAHVACQIPRVNVAATGQDFTSAPALTGMKSGTLASPPTGMQLDELWEDTTASANHPEIRIAKVTT